VLVQCEGKVIFLSERCCSNSLPSARTGARTSLVFRNQTKERRKERSEEASGSHVPLLKRKTLKARCSMPFRMELFRWPDGSQDEILDRF
jgi:hypothetical protein